MCLRQGESTNTITNDVEDRTAGSKIKEDQEQATEDDVRVNAAHEDFVDLHGSVESGVVADAVEFVDCVVPSQSALADGVESVFT